MTENEDFKRMYRSSCKNILLDARIKITSFGEHLGNRFVGKTLNNVINYYNGKGNIGENYLPNILEALRKDIFRDPYICELKKFAPENAKRMLNSYERSVSMMESLLEDLEDNKDEYLKFVQFMSQNRSKPHEIDYNKMEKNRKRILRQAGSDNPSDTFPSLRDQFKQGFEQLYLQVANESIEVISRYPGNDEKKAYRSFEEMVAFERVHTDRRGGIKSDYRAIRNCISHEDYCEIGETMTISFEDGNKMIVNILDASFLNTSMLQKCIYTMQLTSLMNIEVIRKAGKYI